MPKFGQKINSPKINSPNTYRPKITAKHWLMFKNSLFIPTDQSTNIYLTDFIKFIDLVRNMGDF
jgi:hypothetical protein